MPHSPCSEKPMDPAVDSASQLCPPALCNAGSIGAEGAAEGTLRRVFVAMHGLPRDVLLQLPRDIFSLLVAEVCASALG